MTMIIVMSFAYYAYLYTFVHIRKFTPTVKYITAHMQTMSSQIRSLWISIGFNEKHSQAETIVRHERFQHNTIAQIEYISTRSFHQITGNTFEII